METAIKTDAERERERETLLWNRLISIVATFQTRADLTERGRGGGGLSRRGRKYEYFRRWINILNNLREEKELNFKEDGEEERSHKQKQRLLTVVEVSLLVHHERLDLGAVVSAEGEGSGVLGTELVLPGAPEVDGVDEGKAGDAAEVAGRQKPSDLTWRRQQRIRIEDSASRGLCLSSRLNFS